MSTMHLLVNAKHVIGNVDNMSRWKNVFDNTVSATKTTKMRELDFVRFPEKGLTAFVVLSESHISVHTYPENEAYYFDVFSCKKFNVDDVLNILRKEFGPHTLEYEVHER